MIIVGHRGARAHAPENTLRAIACGLDMGADWIEFDVRRVENDFVLMHDDRLEHTTNGRGLVEAQTLETVRALDAGNGERVPLLAEALDHIGDRATTNIELKTPAAATDLAAALAHVDPARLLVSCFDHRALRRFHAAAPRVRLGALIVGLPETNAAFAQDLGAWSVHPSAEFVDPEFVADAHARQLAVIPFTVNDADTFARLAALGVDGVFTDWPDRATNWRRSVGTRAPAL